MLTGYRLNLSFFLNYLIHVESGKFIFVCALCRDKRKLEEKYCCWSNTSAARRFILTVCVVQGDNKKSVLW